MYTVHHLKYLLFFFIIIIQAFETEAQVAVKVRTVIVCALRVYVKDHKQTNKLYEEECVFAYLFPLLNF